LVVHGFHAPDGDRSKLVREKTALFSYKFFDFSLTDSNTQPARGMNRKKNSFSLNEFPTELMQNMSFDKEKTLVANKQLSETSTNSQIHIMNHVFFIF